MSLQKRKDRFARKWTRAYLKGIEEKAPVSFVDKVKFCIREDLNQMSEAQIMQIAQQLKRRNLL